MTIRHHPSDETLAAYAAGTLDEARRLIVATHLSLCDRCNDFVSALDHLGGAMLDRIMPVAMSDGALSRLLQRLDDPELATSVRSHAADKWPAPLREYEMGHWRWVGPGVEWCSVSVPVVNDTRVFMLRARPGTKLPHHRHSGIEWTCVLQGAFLHDGGRFGPGDFDEADEAHEHKPVVDNREPCICIVALQGNIQLQSRLGRLLQPLIRL
ncbi:MAG: ChrR family anti-sigma-E factor [Pseudorhodoplanes sp.]